MKTVKSAAAVSAACACSVLCGCITNDYADHYVTRTDGTALVARYGLPPPESAKIRPVISEDDFLSIMEEGYVPVGEASFVGRHAPWWLALDVAKENQCHLVLIDERFKTKKTYTSILYLPTILNAYMHGTVYADDYLPTILNAYTHEVVCADGQYGSYSGTTTTDGTDAVSVSQTVSLYDQTAMFLRKVDLSGMYGTLLYLPPSLPGIKPDAPCPVTVLAVARGSQAEKDGIKRGDRLAAINGKRLSSRRDAVPFRENPMLIRSVEVLAPGPEERPEPRTEGETR